MWGGGAVIHPSLHIRNLGGYFDNVLNLNYVSNIVKACYEMACNMACNIMSC